MGCQAFDALLKRLFYNLGYQIGKRPMYFVIVPILLTALCATGFQQLDYEYDPEYLFSPSEGAAKKERLRLEEHFPTNYTAFKSSRMTRVGKFGRLVVEAADGGDMLRTELWNQLLYLDQVKCNFTLDRGRRAPSRLHRHLIALALVAWPPSPRLPRFFKASPSSSPCKSVLTQRFFSFPLLYSSK